MSNHKFTAILACILFTFSSTVLAQSEVIFKPINQDLPDPGAGTVERYLISSENYIDRFIDIWLPENYNSDPDQKYNVLYMHDGQMLFDSAQTWNNQSWKAGETLQRLINEDLIDPVIIAGIWNTEEYRASEYFPQKAAAFLSEDVITELSERFEGGLKADNYLELLISEVIPFVEKSYSVHKKREARFIAGSSMGGLISIYAIAEYPEMFAGAACLSTHWIGTFEDNDEIPEAIRKYLSENLPAPGSHRLYFDHGTETLDSLYPRHQQATDKMMKQLGFTDEHYKSRSFPGTDHSEQAWAARFDIPIRFLMGK